MCAVCVCFRAWSPAFCSSDRADRAATIQSLLDPAPRPGDLARPGHIFPLRYAEGGVLKRAGHTEAAVDLSRMAGMYPAGVLCEIVNDDGTMARMPELREFAEKHQMRIVTIADMVAYRMRKELLITRAAETRLPTRSGGEFNAIVYDNEVDSSQHLALYKG